MEYIRNKAFTLIELLIVIAIIAILAAAVIIAINPGEQLAKARDATRERHVKALESAVYIYHIDNLEFPTGITSTLTEICNTNIVEDCTGLVDLSNLEMGSIPVDPRGGVDNSGTGYKVAMIDNRLLIDAQKAETRLVDVNINGLVGWWKMDEDPAIHGTTIADNSGYGNHGTLSTNDGSTNKSVEGKMNRALSFDGVDDYVEVSHNDLLSNNVFGDSIEFTLESWAYPQEWVNYSTIMNKATGGSWSNTTSGMWSMSSGFVCAMGSNVGGNPPNSSIRIYYKPSLNNWYHIACVGNEDTLKMYVDGGYVGQKSISEITHERSQNTEPLIFGKRHKGASESFPGFIDNIRIYRKALSESEIGSLYSQTKHKYLAENE